MKKVRSGEMHFVGSWKERKGLMALLLVGGMILVLAAMAPGVWATPDQSPLRQTIPPDNTIDGFVCNNNDGVAGCQIPIANKLREGVDLSAIADTPIANELVQLDGGVQDTLTNADGYYAFQGLAASSTHVVEALGFSETVTLGAAGEGASQDFWPRMGPIGGYVVPVSRLELLAPWIGLVALMAVVAAAVVARRRRLV